MWNQRLSALAFCLIVLYNESIRIAVQQHWMPAEKRSHIHALLLRKRNAEVNEMLAFGTDNEEVTAKCPGAPFLLSMTDHPDNELSVIIALPRKGEEGADLDMTLYPPEIADGVKDILLKSYPVYEDPEQVYEIYFKDYIIYQCRNESYTCGDSSEIRTGKYLTIYEKSKLLDYYESVLFDFDDDETKSNRKHYCIGTVNHVIDVISNDPPTISKVNPDRLPEH